MKKAMKSICKCLLVFVFAFFAANAFGQQLRYVQTKIINQNGEHEPNHAFAAAVKIYEFQQNGNILVEKGDGSAYSRDIRYRFHHSSDGNNYYYLITNDPRILNVGVEVVVSGDRNIINWNNYNTSGNQQVSWNFTVVYQHQEAQSRGLYQ